MHKIQMLDAALSYAERWGWQTFPAIIIKTKNGGWQKLGRLSGKKTNGVRWGASSDPDVLRGYWRKYPSDRVGIPTGSTNGIFCIDVDTVTVDGHEHDGFEGLRQLEAQHGALPPTRKSQSPSGSQHWYYRLPPDTIVKNSASELAPGVDVRGEGGMIIAPPSSHPRGGCYVWLNDLDVAPAPDWLVELTRKPETNPRTARKITKPPIAARLVAIDARPCDPAMLAAMVADAGVGQHREYDERIKIDAALDVIPADIDYQRWFLIGCAIFNELGDCEGFGVFDRWSSSSVTGKYDPDYCAVKWEQCTKPPRGNPCRAGTIYHIADQYDREWRIEHQADLIDPNWRKRLNGGAA